MSYFNINIDNDITYLLSEIGHNIKVNNIPTKAIINNASMERTFDDKKIITHEELKRGYYLEYNDFFFIVLNEVNDKRYLTYYKGIIRRCNFDLKFIINDKLYLFPIIAEGDKFLIGGDSVISLATDTISVTIPLTSVTGQLKRLNTFIKWGQKWEIQGLDYTKDGLIVLTCKAIANGINDDLDNEIADRYTSDKVDRLNGNITPILPFDEVEEPEEPNPEEPEEPEDPPIEENITYTISGQPQYGSIDNEIYSTEWCKYTIKKFLNDVEVTGVFTYTVDNTNLATITNSTDNTVTVTAKNVVKGGNVILTVTDTDTGQVAMEKTIKIMT